MPLAKSTLCENRTVVGVLGELSDSLGNRSCQTPDTASSAALAAGLSAACGLTAVTALQSQAGVLDACTDAPLAGSGTTIALVGGHVTQRLARYLEREQSPVSLVESADALTERFVSRAGTTLVEFPLTDVSPSHDYLVLQFVPDVAHGALVVHVYGVAAEGSAAAVWYFLHRVLPGLGAGTRAFERSLLLEWTEDGDGNPGDSDSWREIARDVL